MVRDIRRQRRQFDGATVDWLVVRNRLSMIVSRNKRAIAAGLNELSFRLGFRSVDRFAKREVYREFTNFSRGSIKINLNSTALLSCKVLQFGCGGCQLRCEHLEIHPLGGERQFPTAFHLRIVNSRDVEYSRQLAHRLGLRQSKSP